MRRLTFLGIVAVMVSTAGAAVLDMTEVEAATKPGVIRTYSDCEDTITVPCVTFDEGHWRKVTDYSPYRSIKLYKCSLTKVNKLPCVFTKKQKGGFVVGSKK